MIMAQPNTNAPLLEARNVTIRFGGLMAVSEFHLAVQPQVKT